VTAPDTAPGTASHRSSPATVARALVADAVAVVVFVAVGRRSHDEGGDPVTATLEVAAPFLLAAALGWAVTRAWRRPLSLVTGLGIWAVTVTAGMLLRRVVFDRGTAASFVVVATIATATLLLGWRAIALAVSRRRS
jgi:hypothetical protein